MVEILLALVIVCIVAYIILSVSSLVAMIIWIAIGDIRGH